MKGVSFITDEHARKKAVVIDMKVLSRHQEALEDFLDVVIAESRKGDEDISWSAALKELKA